MLPAMKTVFQRCFRAVSTGMCPYCQKSDFLSIIAPAMLLGAALASTIMAQTPSNVGTGNSTSLGAAASTPRISGELKQAAILETAHAVADWQLEHPSKFPAKHWAQGPFYDGVMAISKLPGGQKYEEAMLRMGKANGWKIGKSGFYANDHCVGRTYCELYFKSKQEFMIQPLREQLDTVVNMPVPPVQDFKDRASWKRWSWCDALYMASPTWVRLYAATHEKKYLDYMNTEWWAATEYLYDKEEHLFFRDSTYLWNGREHPRKEANGKKVFWGRGNGWVLGGLALVIQHFPKDHPDYPRYVTLFKEMSAKVLQCQHPDGMWGASMLDPERLSMKEASASGLFCYALAFGVNNGYLDRATYEPAVKKSWTGLVGCVEPSGRLAYVQGVGQGPAEFSPQGTEVYAPGILLLAAAEMYKLVQ